MLRFSVASVLSITVLCYAGAQAVGQADRDGKKPILLTQNNFGHVVKASNGDIIEVRLPSQLAMKWVLVEKQTVLHPIEGVTPEPEPTPKSAYPTLGAGGYWVQRYRISTSHAANSRPTWIYCRFGRPEMTKKRIDEGVIPAPNPLEFGPGVKPSDLREGMIYQFSLAANP